MFALGPGFQFDWQLNIPSRLYQALQLVTQAIEWMLSNDVFIVIFAASLIPIGLQIFKKAKRAVK